MWKCQISQNLITSKHISRHQTMNIEGTWWWDSSRSYTIEGNYISCSILLNKIVFMGVSCSYCDTSIYFKQPKHVPNVSVQNTANYCFKNLHFSQKLCWQHGIITAFLKYVLQRGHFISDGKSTFWMAWGLAWATL